MLREKNAPRSGRPQRKPAGQPEIKPEKAVLCKACRSLVTSLDTKLSINGKHEHTFFNPAGIVFEVRCFSKAPGCVEHGVPTSEFTWFPVYSWQYCLCSTCFEHLGWYYTSPTDSFYGLIGGNLIIGEPR